jgi:hypothetical protein
LGGTNPAHPGKLWVMMPKAHAIAPSRKLFFTHDLNIISFHLLVI